MRLGADPSALDRLAREHRALADSLRRAAVPPGRAAGTGSGSATWSGPDAERFGSVHRHRIVGPALRCAADLERAAATLVRHARDQRAASAAPASAVTLRDDPRDGGRFVHRVGAADASSVVVLVPGVGTDRGDSGALATTARRLHDDLAPAVDSLAVVAWLGYDPPDSVLGGLDLRPAQEGAGLLVAEVAALRRRDRPGGPARVVLVGHSYGGHVVGRAVGLGVDAHAAVLLGSPGAGLDDPGRLPGGRRVRVLAALADGDPIEHVPALTGGRFGADPRRIAEPLPTSRRGHGDYLSDPLVLSGLADVLGEPVRSVHRRP